MSDREAPGELGLIQAFVNTVDLGDGPEEFTNPNTFQSWLVARGLLEAGEPVAAADLKNGIAVREAVRATIGVNSGYPVYPVDVATLNQAASASRLRLRFGPDGRSRLEPEATGVVGAIGRIVAALDASVRDETWPLLKLCGDPACRWAFYDQSRNHSSRWCDMKSCGNRQKARRFRSRAKSASAS
jgi:predicted RNA-binding Zn ribbon-like protein